MLIDLAFSYGTVQFFTGNSVDVASEVPLERVDRREYDEHGHSDGEIRLQTICIIRQADVVDSRMLYMDLGSQKFKTRVTSMCLPPAENC